MDRHRRIEYSVLNDAFVWENPWVPNGETHAAYVGLHGAFGEFNPLNHVSIIVFVTEESEFYNNERYDKLFSNYSMMRSLFCGMLSVMDSASEFS